VSRREQQRQETRRKVFEAALHIFRRDGVSESRIEDIATLAGVSRGTFYFHFPTKEAVLTELLLTAEADFTAEIDALPADAPIEDVLNTTAAAMARPWSAEPLLWMEVGLVAMRNTADKLAHGKPTDGIRAVLGRRFEAAAGTGELSGLVPAQIIADFYLANAFAVAVSWSTNPDIMPLDAALRAAAILFLDGARVRPA
jgi:AcrR family transcriptional regulator